MKRALVTFLLALLFSMSSSCPAAEAPRKVAILLFPGVQIIDYTGPFEVFGQAGFEVFTVAEEKGPLRTNMGMTVTPDHTFADAPAADLLVLPGGDVPSLAGREHAAVRWILQTQEKASTILSVCNGAFWLANAGLLDGLEATTYYGLLGELRSGFPKVRVVADKRFCDNGRIITTAGLSSGIDGALHVVGKLLGPGRARSVALNMEYDWKPDSTYARGGFADRFLRAGGRFSLKLGEGAKARLLDRQGDREHWDERWQVEASGLTLAAVRTKAAAALPQSWRAEGDGAFRFEDESGGRWLARLAVEAEESSRAGFVVSVAIRRAGGEGR